MASRAERLRLQLQLLFAADDLIQILEGVGENKRVWVKKWMRNRRTHGHLTLLKELENHQEDYINFLRMDIHLFNDLLARVHSYIVKQDTVMREALTPEEKLVATLRFLATGRSYRDLCFSTRISVSSLSEVIPTTCQAIYYALKEEFMKFPSTPAEWMEISENFSRRWQVVNVGGCMDGKHIRIQKPRNSGALYYNYKGFYSIVLFALVNSNHEFLYVDVGKNGRVADGGVLEGTEFYRRLEREELNLPTNEQTSLGLNFVFLGDSGFPLTHRLMKPYPDKNITKEEKLFNYRLSRGRNVTENSFGLLAARFRVLHTPINMLPENAISVVLGICMLHNYLKKKSQKYATNSSLDFVNEDGNLIQNADWRNDSNNLTRLQTRRYQPTNSGKIVRDEYRHFYNTVGAVEWQDFAIEQGRA